VSAPLFLVDELPAEGSFFTLGGPEGHHAATVQRLRTGEELMLSDGWGGTAGAVVVAVTKGALTVRVGARSYEPAPNPRLVVAQGIPKGDRGELAVQAMTETGVDVIVPWSATRSVAQWRAERGEKSRQRWIDTAREATKQSRRSWLASVAPAASTKEVAARAAKADLALVLHEEASARLTTVELPVAGEILLVIGPEGGVAAEELSLFVEAGAHPVRLGAAVLRTSTAGVAALSVLSARLGRW
jgi:16S rRNA (uracil1498-N3)-methyltransferase